MKWIVVLFFLNLKNCSKGDDSVIMDVKLEDFPYMASIKRDNSFCQGALITKDFVLTSALCLRNPTNIKVYVGFLSHPSHYPRTVSAEGIQIYESAKIYVHEDFEKISGDSAYNDLALVKLSQPVTVTSKVRPGKIMSKNDFELLKAKLVNISGWSDNGDINRKFSSGRLLDQDRCTQFFGSSFLSNQELCLVISVRNELDLVGNLVSIGDKIVGFRVRDRGCLVDAPACRRTAIVLNLVHFLDWISEKTNVPASELSGQAHPEVSFFLFVLVCLLFLSKFSVDHFCI